MIYQPDYTIRIDGQDINFLFVSFMFKKYCDRKGIELDDLFKIVSKTLTREGEQTEEMKDVKDLKTSDYADILLAANETYCVYHKTPFTATEADAYAWIDTMGGLVQGKSELMKLFTVFVGKLLNIDLSLLTATSEPQEQAEKNVVPPVLNGSPGANSTSVQQQAA